MIQRDRLNKVLCDTFAKVVHQTQIETPCRIALVASRSEFFDFLRLFCQRETRKDTCSE